MARYYRQDISSDETLPRPATEPLIGLRPARSAPLRAVMRAQDSVIPLCRRVVLTQGLSGADNWLVGNTNPRSNTLDHPFAGVARTVAPERFTLTPGCMLELRAIVGLSGQTQKDADAGEGVAYIPAGCNAEIRVQVSWDDGGPTVTRNFTVNLPPSLRQYGAAPTAQGGQFAEERIVRIPLMKPYAVMTTPLLRRFCQPTVCTVVVQHVGGARVADLCIAEKPWQIAMEADDPVWVAHLYGSTDPGGTGPAISYPYQRLSETSPDGNPRGGTWHLMNVAGYQAERLGPCLLSWTAWDEDGESVSATDAAGVTSTTTAFRHINNSGIGTYDAANEGWSFSAGAYARRSRENDPQGMPQNGVIPIRVRCYASASSSPGVLRVQSSAYEWVDVDITSATPAWHTAMGYARVGKGPGDPSVVQVFLRRNGGAGTITLYAVEVHHSGQFANPL